MGDAVRGPLAPPVRIPFASRRLFRCAVQAVTPPPWTPRATACSRGRRCPWCGSPRGGASRPSAAGSRRGRSRSPQISAGTPRPRASLGLLVDAVKSPLSRISSCNFALLLSRSARISANPPGAPPRWTVPMTLAPPRPVMRKTSARHWPLAGLRAKAVCGLPRPPRRKGMRGPRWHSRGGNSCVTVT